MNLLQAVTIMPSSYTGLPVADAFKAPNLAGVLQTSDVFSGTEFLIGNGSPEHPKLDLQKAVFAHGGSIILHWTPGAIVVCERINIPIRNIIKSRDVDVYNVEWLISSLENKRLMPKTPKYMHYSSSKSEIRSD